MLINEIFDTLVFLCGLFIGASVLMSLVYFFCNYVLRIDLDWY